jgi:hypothetical protein
MKSPVPSVRNSINDTISMEIRGAHDKRCLIPNLSRIRAGIEEMIHGFGCLSTKHANRGPNKTPFRKVC